MPRQWNYEIWWWKKEKGCTPICFTSSTLTYFWRESSFTKMTILLDCCFFTDQCSLSVYFPYSTFYSGAMVMDDKAQGVPGAPWTKTFMAIFSGVIVSSLTLLTADWNAEWYSMSSRCCQQRSCRRVERQLWEEKNHLKMSVGLATMRPAPSFQGVLWPRGDPAVTVTKSHKTDFNTQSVVNCSSAVNASRKKNGHYAEIAEEVWTCVDREAKRQALNFSLPRDNGSRGVNHAGHNSRKGKQVTASAESCYGWQVHDRL